MTAPLSGRKTSFAPLGVLIGIIFGYPLSYYFQPEALRMKLSMGGYVEHIGEVLKNSDLQSTAVGTWIVTIIALGVIGAAVDQAQRK